MKRGQILINAGATAALGGGAYLRFDLASGNPALGMRQAFINQPVEVERLRPETLNLSRYEATLYIRRH